eukprot:259494_1
METSEIMNAEEIINAAGWMGNYNYNHMTSTHVHKENNNLYYDHTTNNFHEYIIRPTYNEQYHHHHGEPYQYQNNEQNYESQKVEHNKASTNPMDIKINELVAGSYSPN